MLSREEPVTCCAKYVDATAKVLTVHARLLFGVVSPPSNVWQSEKEVVVDARPCGVVVDVVVDVANVRELKTVEQLHVLPGRFWRKKWSETKEPHRNRLG